MKKISLLITALVMLLVTNVYAQNISLERASRMGEMFMKENTSLAEQRNSINLSHSHTFISKDGNDCLHVFNVDGGGFVVVSAEERVKPVLAYSTKGSFDVENMADGLKFMLSSYQDEIEYIRENNIAMTDDIAKEWRLLETKGRITEAKSSDYVLPLLPSTWNQNYPYNALCPEDTAGSGGHVYAGCVATAMAQVINYWKYPSQGEGSHSYVPFCYMYEQTYTYPMQEVNFGETHYNFERMPIFLDSLSSEEDIYDVALLQYHCGVSVDMMYSPEGSGAYSEDVPSAMNQYFGYNYGMVEYEWNFSHQEWIDALKEELGNGRPLYYSGQDDSGAGGHAFVCDGYDENDFFHFNWGWGGRDDAYCAIGALNTTKYAFNTWTAAIFDLYPRADEYFSRPDEITEFNITDLEDNTGVAISWVNPTKDLSGNDLTSIDTVFLRRDFVVVATFTDVQVGETMTFTDVVEEGLYEYSVYTNNVNGNSPIAYKSHLIGDKCDLIFELNDEGGDGWKGGSISIFNEDERIAIVTLEDGASLVDTVSLLKDDLNFVWNKCWYSEEYYTCDEVSFKIKDLEGNVLYESEGEMQTGIFLTYDNDCSLNVYETEADTEKVSIYPNPSDGKIMIESNNISQIEIFNVIGQSLATISVDADFCEIDMSDFNEGLYFVKIKTADETITRKVILTD